MIEPSQAPQGDLAVQPGQGFRPISVWPTEKNEASRYVRVDNALVQNSELSFRARGLLAYVLSMPKDFVHSAERLSMRSPDGVTAIRSALRELRELGYASMKNFRNEDGTVRMRWEFRESPSTEKQHSVNSSPGSENLHSAPDAGLPSPGQPGFGQPHFGQPGSGFPAPLITKLEETKLQVTKIGETKISETKCPPGTDNAPGDQKVLSPAVDPHLCDDTPGVGEAALPPRESVAASGYPEPVGWRDALRDDDRLDPTDFRLPWGDRSFTDGKKRYVIRRMEEARHDTSGST